jgi:hypothetical protein
MSIRLQVQAVVPNQTVRRFHTSAPSTCQLKYQLSLFHNLPLLGPPKPLTFEFKLPTFTTWPVPSHSYFLTITTTASFSNRSLPARARSARTVCPRTRPKPLTERRACGPFRRRTQVPPYTWAPPRRASTRTRATISWPQFSARCGHS